MNNALKLTLILIIILLFISPTGLIANTGITTSQRQDGRFLKKLEWYSPNGELPGTYEEYILLNPLESALIFQSQEFEPNVISSTKSISILVDQLLFLNIKSSIDEYISDLQAEGFFVHLQKIIGGTPQEIKDWVTERYNAGSEGFVFIGDITAAWAEVSGSVFPCDLFYMDLDGNWEDEDSDGDYEIHTSGEGDMGPEVYVGRIYADSLTYDSEANMINEYLSKVHAYRIGELSQTWKSLEYIDEDWYDMDVFLRYIYGEDVTRFDSGFNTTAEGYLNQLNFGQHFVQVCAHSYSAGHHFGTRPTKSASYAHSYIYSPTTRQAKLLMGSDDGIKVWLNSENVYTNDRYGEWSPDNFEADISLNEGWNQLLCKISQEGGNYQFSVQLTDSYYNTFDDLKYQINNPDFYDGEAEFIRSWLLNGFHQDTSDNFWYYLTTNYLGVDEKDINPEEGEVMGGNTWTVFDSGNPYIDMGKHCNYADYGVCYAFVKVNAINDISCQLWMGYDDGARVWLNGNEILFDNRYGGFVADMTKVNVTLQPGENRLLVKVSEWMGNHGFSARLCNPDGTTVEGLSFDPPPTPISYIGLWLINGPYYNADQSTRLNTDYLGEEANTTPSEGDSAPIGEWERGIGNGYPFNLGQYFDHGDWVLSGDIQTHDPPVLFYNLFACGPGRFTDENYLAGAYIFNTSYGLITVASSKSGSMLNFDDFNYPLSQQKTIGESFRDWFEAQAPYLLWEKEWYYGMVVCGDPTLFIINNNHPIEPDINGPNNGIIRTEYEYKFSAEDPDGEKIYYFIDWGDDSNSGWLGPYSSGLDIILSHKWNIGGNYIIQARVKDTNNLLSPWNTLEVNIPKNQQSRIFNWLESYPLLLYFIQKLLRFS
ncbi:MAG: hypothetical protein JSU91_05165 [Thermoplasmatales archaeon]|nr:MAG: hypothetical protein JSU91_05165 [Thermoplasmatales archaeon]